MKKSILLAACLTSVSGAAVAQELPEIEAYLGAARYFWDSDRNLDDATAIEAGVEAAVTDELSFELWANDFDVDPENGGDEQDGNRYSLGALYHLMDGDYRPFVTLGASHQSFDTDDFDAHETLAYLGVGAKKYLDNNIILRGDLFAMNSIDYEVTDVGLRIAVGYAFGGGSSSKSSATESEPMPAKAEPMAEPAPQPMPAEPKPAEPAPAKPMPAPMPVEPPKDSDGDGVIDSADKCPETDKAFKVDEMGCPVKLMESVSINLEVKFKTNSAEVTPDSEPEIAETAAFLKKFSDTSVTVEGHTDDRGSAAYNKTLSQKRADAVKQKLVNDYGIAADRVSAVGYGEERPVATNDTAEGRATNRRVVAVIEANVETMQTR